MIPVPRRVCVAGQNPGGVECEEHLIGESCDLFEDMPVEQSHGFMDIVGSVVLCMYIFSSRLLACIHCFTRDPVPDGTCTPGGAYRQPC